MAPAPWEPKTQPLPDGTERRSSDLIPHKRGGESGSCTAERPGWAITSTVELYPSAATGREQ